MAAKTAPPTPWAKLSKPQQLKRWRGQPVTAGSELTRGQLGQQTSAAMKVKYAPVVQAQKQELRTAQGAQRDVGGFYDQYLRQVAQGAENVRAAGAAAAQQTQGLQAGVTGLANTDLTQLNQRATADAAARGATPGDISQMASNAAAVRQALVASFGAQQAARTQSDVNAADTRANVVAPGQKLQAQAGAAKDVAKVRAEQTVTAGQRGGDALTYRAQALKDEADRVLARTVATGKDVAAQATAKLNRDKLTETTAHDRATEAIANKRAARDATNADGATGRKYGYDAKTWAGMSVSARQQVIKDFTKGKGRGSGSGSGGPKLLTPGQAGSGLTQVSQLKEAAQRAKIGQPLVAGRTGKRPKLNRGQAATALKNIMGPKLKNPVLLSAALDAVYDGHLSTSTMQRLLAAGYRRKDVADTLATLTRHQWDKQQAGKGAAMIKKNTAAAGPSYATPQGHL